MKYFLLTFLAISIVCVASMAGSPPKSIFPYKYKVEKLANGLTVIMIPMPNPGLAAYYSIVRTGSRDEWEPGHSGFAHFFEHMMFRGTEKYPGSAYDKLMTEMGVDANASTTDDYTWYYLKIAKENLEKVFELESDRFQNLSYKEPEFQTEAGAVLGEYNKGRTSPFSVLFEKTREVAFDRHTYKHTTIGFQQDVLAMPTMYEYSKSFFQRYYRPENVVVLVAGDIDYAETMQLAKKYYSDWKPGYVQPKIEQEPAQTAERKATVSFEGKTLPILALAYKGLAFDATNKEIAAVDILSDVAFSETSEIYKKLVLDEQKVDFINADFSSNRDPGLWAILTRIKNEKDIDYVHAEIDKALEKFKTTLVDEKKLSDTKKRSRYGFVMNLDTPAKVASALTRYIAFTGGVEAIEQLFASYERVTAQDVQAVAKKYFTTERRTVVTLTGGQK